MNKVTVFLPCREGSQRIKNKNIKPFSNVEKGLIYIKLKQLINVENIEKIIVSTNDREVKEVAKSFNNSKIIIDNRSELLSSSNTSTDELIKYVPSIIKKDTILWTHVTSPFVNEKVYKRAIETYFSNLHINDSLMSVTKIQKFLWNKNTPINYNKEIEKWPRTQTLEPLYEVNSGIFITNRDTYIQENDRIGKKPFLFEIDEKTAFDIDWEIDFELAEILWRKNEKD
jgi:CMP-N-acetylneuraminic acid synthetase